MQYRLRLRYIVKLQILMQYRIVYFPWYIIGQQCLHFGGEDEALFRLKKKKRFFAEAITGKNELACLPVVKRECKKTTQPLQTFCTKLYKQIEKYFCI